MDTQDRMITTLLAEPAASAHATAAARRGLMNEIDGTSVRRRPARTLRWSLVGTSVAAVGLAVAMTIGNAAAPGETGGGGTGVVAAPPVAGPGADASPRQLLLAAATSAQHPAGAGKYWRVLTVEESGPLTAGTGRDAYQLLQREANETWTSRDPDGQSWNGQQSLGARPRTAADLAAWKRDGSPRTISFGPADTSIGGQVTRSLDPGKGVLRRDTGDPTYESAYGPLELAGLPTDPKQLRAAVNALIEKSREGGPPATRGEDVPAIFSVLSGLLTDAPASPALRSAAFTVLSALPGVANKGPRRDGSGRSGVALELRRNIGPQVETQWMILDPSGYRLLSTGASGGDRGADGQIDVSHGKPFKEVAKVLLKAEWTDQKPVPPALR
jgi:hypothetical protein